MKQLCAIALIAAFIIAPAALQAAPDLAAFRIAMEDFSMSMAGSLSLNSSIGSVWSDSFIGSFPHWGLGFYAGAGLTGQGSLDQFFMVLEQEIPEYLKFGIPVPATGVSLKIGMPKVPLDLGVKGCYVPGSLIEAVAKDSGVAAEFWDVGISLRYGVLKEKGFIPEISIGVGADYQKGGITTAFGAGATTVEQKLSNSGGTTDTWRIVVSEPNADIAWESINADVNVQISKKLLFFRPYAGVGCTFGKTTVQGGIKSNLTFYRNLDSVTYEDLIQALKDAGITPPDELSSTGISYNIENTKPIFRVYGGFSLDIFMIVLDTQVIYVPQTKALGAAAMLRVQL